MSTESDMFWQARAGGLIFPGNQEALRLLRQAAAGWRQTGRPFNAGLAMTEAILAAWGTDGGVAECAAEARQDFLQCEATAPPCHPESLLALQKRAPVLHRYTPDTPPSLLWEEIGNRLLTHYSNDPNAGSYLVRGCVFRSDLDGEWVPEFPPHEVDIGTEKGGPGFICTSFPSAFRLFVMLTDYQAANQIAEQFPDAFSTPGLRGWKCAVRGFVVPNEAPERFAEAALAFAEDRMPTTDEERSSRGGWWSSINVDLWTKYFRARAAFATIVRQPDKVPELLRTAAAELAGTESGWQNPNVSQFRPLVQTLAQLLDEQPGFSPSDARSRYLSEITRVGQQPADDVTLQFLSLVAEAFDGFKTDPAGEMVRGRLPAAMEALARIPLLEPGITPVLSATIGERALAVATGNDRSWVHRTLAGITNEAVFRSLLLRLLQASPSPPAYAHIRHGPVEYGKDIVVLLEEGGRHILRMYQAKCGDVTTPGWRESRYQLEEMFQVRMPSFQLTTTPDSVEGILVCNGHANNIVELAMEGWFEEQTRDHGRSFRFMHLDALVNWVHSQRLYSTFRRSCSELGIQIE